MKCTKAIILIAGFGTRRLPITKAIEKYMLPIGNRPLIDYVVEDCVKAGITDIIFVVGERYDQLRTYYGNNQPLETYLAAKGKTQQLQQLADISKQAQFHYVIQDSTQAYGTAVPVALCADYIGENEQALVIAGDDFIYNRDGSSEVKRLLDGVAASGATAGLLASRVPKDQVFKYGVIDMQKHDGKEFFKRIIEKPAVQDAPSNLINISKYLFDSQMMQAVKEVLQRDAAANGEYQVTDALDIYVESGKKITVVPVVGEYLDGGTVEGWLNANNVVLGQ